MSGWIARCFGLLLRLSPSILWKHHQEISCLGLCPSPLREPFPLWPLREPLPSPQRTAWFPWEWGPGPLPRTTQRQLCSPCRGGLCLPSLSTLVPPPAPRRNQELSGAGSPASGAAFLDCSLSCTTAPSANPVGSASDTARTPPLVTLSCHHPQPRVPPALG